MAQWRSMTAFTVLVAVFAAPAPGAKPGEREYSWRAEPAADHSKPAPAETVPQKTEEYRATQIIGTYVRNLEGETLGRIGDLLFDPQDTGRVLFAVIIHGGLLGVGGKLIAVPFPALTWNERDRAYDVNITKERLALAPGFYRDHWPDLHHRAWSEEVYRFYGQSPYWMEEDK